MRSSPPPSIGGLGIYLFATTQIFPHWNCGPGAVINPHCTHQEHWEIHHFVCHFCNYSDLFDPLLWRIIQLGSFYCTRFFLNLFEVVYSLFAEITAVRCRKITWSRKALDLDWLGVVVELYALYHFGHSQLVESLSYSLALLKCSTIIDSMRSDILFNG